MLKKTTIIYGGLLIAACAFADNVNVAKSIYGTRAVIETKSGSTQAAPAIDGRYDDNSSVKLSGTPATLRLDFPEQYNVSRVRIYPGMLLYANYPSSESGIKSYRLEGLINGGWKLLAKQDNAPDYKHSGHSGNAEHFYEHKFAPMKIDALRLVVLESGFTGKTMASGGKAVIAPKDRHSFIREIEVFQEGKKIKAVNALSDKIETDFRLPVYRDQQQAKLVIDYNDKKPLELNISVNDAKNSSNCIAKRAVKLKSGRNEVEFDISTLPSGRYLTTLETAAGNSTVKGSVVRLLRIDRLPPAAPPKEPVNVDNRKVFPFDNYYIAERSGVKNKLAQAKIHQAAGLLAPNRIMQRSWNMNFDDNGNLVIKFFDATRTGKDRKWHYAWSKDLKNWQIGDEPPTGKEVYSPSGPAFPDEVVPDWKVTAKNSDDVFRFYNPEVDGKPDLKNILVRYSTVKKVKWGKIDIPYRSSFAVWQKKNGEVVLLSKDPLLVDRVSYEADELEKENFTNDNFAPQYLGDGGKILYYPRGAMVRRFKPFTVEYDNLTQGFRLLKIFYTQDGFNWKHTFFTLPTDKDPWSYQHYGANILRIPRADLFIAYLYVYDVAKQQIYLEINFSRDGLRWERMPDQPPFVANGKLGEWNSGMIFIDGRHIERDGVYYHVMGHTTSACHFYVPCYSDDLSGMSPQSLERRFQSRELEKWPYFKPIGSWQGLSANMLAAHASTGVLTFRKDSWIGIDAEGTGKLVSRILEAKDCQLAVNTAIKQGGTVKIEVLSADGKKLPLYSGGNAAVLDMDATAAKVKWNQGKISKLPSEPFKLEISLDKATLYTLDFINNNRVVVDQSFDDKKVFHPDNMEDVVKTSGNPSIYWRKFQDKTVEIVKDEKDNQAVLLTRVDGAEGLSMRGFAVGKDKSYELSFDIKRYPEGAVGIGLDCFSPKTSVFAIYVNPKGRVNVKSGKERPYYAPTSIVLDADKWYRVTLDFNSENKSYSLTAVDRAGNEQKSQNEIILPKVEKINVVSFRPAPGIGNKTLIDTIKLREK